MPGHVGDVWHDGWPFGEHFSIIERQQRNLALRANLVIVGAILQLLGLQVDALQVEGQPGFA
jgi:hypothetical protein